MLSTIIKKKRQEAELPKDTQVVMTAAQVTLRPLICPQLCAFYALPCPQAIVPTAAVAPIQLVLLSSRLNLHPLVLHDR